ncbi:MAG: hypothetical protein ACE141_19015 [Bryobacteraceae bacterium]
MIPLAVIEPARVPEMLQRSRSVLELPSRLLVAEGKKDVLEKRPDLAVGCFRVVPDEVFDRLLVVSQRYVEAEIAEACLKK